MNLIYIIKIIVIIKNKDNLEDDNILTSEEQFSSKENINEELNKTIFPNKI